jgi:NAD+ synthase (glutamine-hydrolysing)
MQRPAGPVTALPALRAAGIYENGLVRVAACCPVTIPADPAANTDGIVALAREAAARHAALALFPELAISGYAIDDLVLQSALLDAVEGGLKRLLEESKAFATVLIVGAPLRVGPCLYNCAVVLQRGRVLGIVPKTFLPNYREFYEKRYFAAGDEALDGTLCLAGQDAPFGTGLVFACSDQRDFSFHIEICEDLWSATPPSSLGALAGATVLCNLSASNVTIGKASERDLLCDSQSRRTIAAYVYAAAGYGESTTDLAWDGQTVIYEFGEKLAQGQRFATQATLITADIDVERLQLERQRVATFRDAAARQREALKAFRKVPFALGAMREGPVPLERAVARFPYVPADSACLNGDCFEAYNIQVQGLMTRLKASKISKAVIGVSGGLDSTHALLVAVRAFDLMGLARRNIIAVTMPGFATGARTKQNAQDLMRHLGLDARELDIKPAATQMLSDIGHPFSAGEMAFDITFENVQAGLRTDYLFRIANYEGGLVLGTGDLSELALGWCTYGVGDHMSHYNVNASIPKTLIQHLIRWCAAGEAYDAPTRQTLMDILGTAISPELVPPDAQGNIQRTEDVIGPYELADFALYYVTRYGLRPSKILFLAMHAWSDAARGAWPAQVALADRRAYSAAEIAKWLRVFLYRFFAVSQFKRSCVPNGPKVSSGGSLSPRGDWRAPSDASARAWLDAFDAAFEQPKP